MTGNFIPDKRLLRRRSSANCPDTAGDLPDSSDQIVKRSILLPVQRRVAQGFLCPYLCTVGLRKEQNLIVKQSIKHIKTIWLWSIMIELQLSDILTNCVKSKTAFFWIAIFKFVRTIWKKISEEKFWSALGITLATFGSSILFTMITARRINISSSTRWVICKQRFLTTGRKSWQELTSARQKVKRAEKQEWINFRLNNCIMKNFNKQSRGMTSSNF